MFFTSNGEVKIPFGKSQVYGILAVPLKAEGIVIFAHGNDSSSHSPRDQKIASYLHERNFGTLLFDMMTPDEDAIHERHNNVDFLTRRLISATLWLEAQAVSKGLPLALFGSGTAAAAALEAAAYLPEISTVVCRGGRPDMAIGMLTKVKAPTLLIAGSLDHDILQSNQEAYLLLSCPKKLEIVEGATHLFEENGMLNQVCEVSYHWLLEHKEEPMYSR